MVPLESARPKRTRMEVSTTITRRRKCRGWKRVSRFQESERGIQPLVEVLRFWLATREKLLRPAPPPSETRGRWNILVRVFEPLCLGKERSGSWLDTLQGSNVHLHKSFHPLGVVFKLRHLSWQSFAGDRNFLMPLKHFARVYQDSFVWLANYFCWPLSVPFEIHCINSLNG